MLQLSPRAVSWLFYSVVPVLTLLLALTLMGLWDADLTVPLEPHGDGLLHATFVRIIAETGWIFGTDSLGAPGSLDLLAFPAFDTLGVIIIRIVSLFLEDHFLILNLSYLLSYPLIALTSLWSARKLGASWVAASMVAILYTLLPFHFRRGVGHLFLSFYLVVPLACALSIVVLEGWRFREPDARLSRTQAIVIAIVTGLSGLYYSFFSASLLSFAAIVRFCRRWKLRDAGTALLLLTVLAGTTLVAVTPILVSSVTDDTISPVWREPSDAERYGLKIAQLILPVTDHRISLFEEVKDKYNAGPLNNENDISSLGLVGAVGFVFLLGAAMIAPFRPLPTRYASLSALNLWAVLLGTIGGFGAIFALEISDKIRAYNRLSVFIAFFSLMTIALGLDRLRSYTRFPGRWVPAITILLVLYGALDQTNSNFARIHDNAEAISWERFGEQVDGLLAPGARVLQLPYFPFPENGQIHELHDYDHFRPYLFTDSYRWSYGAIKHSYIDLWQKNLVDRPASDLVAAAALTGFDAIYVDRNGFPDGGVALIGEIESQLGQPLIRDEADRYRFYALESYAKQLNTPEQEERVERLRRQVVEPILTRWGGGCYGLERGEYGTNRWCKPSSSFHIVNGSKVTRTVSLRFTIASVRRDATISFRSPFGDPHFEVTPEGRRLEFTLDVPPGSHRVRFRSTEEPFQPDGDSRLLGVRFENFELEPVEDPASEESAAAA